MNDENMMSRNVRNSNDFSEGKTNRVIRDPAVTYEYGAYSTTKTPQHSIQNHQCKMSIACQSGTDIMHSIGNVTAIMLQWKCDCNYVAIHTGSIPQWNIQYGTSFNEVGPQTIAAYTETDKNTVISNVYRKSTCKFTSFR